MLNKFLATVIFMLYKSQIIHWIHESRTRNIQLNLWQNPNLITVSIYPINNI